MAIWMVDSIKKANQIIKHENQIRSSGFNAGTHIADQINLLDLVDRLLARLESRQSPAPHFLNIEMVEKSSHGQKTET